MAKSAKKAASFEENLARLETLVTQLEAPALPLTEAIAFYEEGVYLIKECQKTLQDAEQKIVILTEGKHES